MLQKVTLIKGDGVGPELADAAQRCVDATGASIEWDIQEAGLDIMGREGTPLPGATLNSLESTGIALKAPITTPVGAVESINVHLRQHFDLYACLRPCKTYPGVPVKHEDIDLVIVRENTEGLYSGFEYPAKGDDTIELIQWLNRHSEREIKPDSGLSVKPTSAQATERILRFAFEYAQRNGRQKVTSVHKANIMRGSDGLWLEISRDVAKRYPNIAFEDSLVDNLGMHLMQQPEQYDIIVLPNLYGDIISDLVSGLVGGLGMAPSAHLGDKTAIFEPVHGGVPKYKGQNKVNPTAFILSGVLLLRHLGLTISADQLENAVAQVIAEGQNVTYDLKPHRNDPAAVGTHEMADAIIGKIERTD